MAVRYFFPAVILILSLQGTTGFSLPSCRSEIRLINRMPQLYIDGSPVMPLAYKTLGKQPGDGYWSGCLETVARMRDSGLHLYQVGLALNELGLPRLLLRNQPVVYDDSELDEIIAVDPQARFIISLGLTPDPYYRSHNQISATNQYPSTEDYSQMIWHQSTVDGTVTPLYRYESNGTRQSPLSERVWQDVELSVSNVIGHFESKYGDRIFMYWPAFGDLGEWYYGIWYGGQAPGFDPNTSAGFRSWTQEKYGSIAAANSAWGTSFSSFDAITVPSWTNRAARRSTTGDFFDPANDRYEIDFFDFFNGTMNYGAKRIAACIKAQTGRAKLVGMFWQYLHPLAKTSLDKAGLNHSGHLKLMDLLECPDIDALGAPIYPEVDHQQMPFHGTVDTIQEHGKLFWHENDMATHLSLSTERSSGIDETLKIYGYDFQEWCARRCGAWLFDIVLNGETNSILNDPAVWKYIQAQRIYWERHIAAANKPFTPEIAVIRNEVSARYMVSRNPVLPAVYSADKTNQLTQMIRHIVETRDTPVGWYLLDDFIAGRVPPAKIYIFADAFAVSGAQAAAISERLNRSAGSAAVWFYAPGFIDPDGGSASADQIRVLTGGIPAGRFALPVRDRIRPVVHTLTGGVPEFGTGYTNLLPQFFIQNGTAGLETLGVYADDTNRIAAACLPADGISRRWHSVYICSPSAPPELFKNLAVWANLSEADGFNATNLTQWTAGSGVWQVAQGELFQVGARSNTAWTAFNEHAAGNFTMEGDVHISGSGWAGIQFRKTASGDSPFQSGYLVHVRENGYVTLYKPGGAIAGAAASAGASNGFLRLKVTAVGSAIVVLADGTPVITATDTAYTNGFFGLSTSQTTNGVFDNIRISEAVSDADDDGLPNDWEHQYFGGIAGADAVADSDGDSFSNLAEFIAGTNPVDAASRFGFSTEFSPGGFILNWDAVSGRVYSVSRSTNLITGFTDPFLTGLDFSSNCYTADVNAAGAALFYKINVQLRDSN